MDPALLNQVRKLSLNVQTVIFGCLETAKLFEVLDNLSKRHRPVIKKVFSDRFYVIAITDAKVDNYTTNTIVPRFRKMAEKCRRFIIIFENFNPMKLWILDQIRLPEYSNLAQESNLELCISDIEDSIKLNELYSSGDSFKVNQLVVRTMPERGENSSV